MDDAKINIRCDTDPGATEKIKAILDDWTDCEWGDYITSLHVWHRLGKLNDRLIRIGYVACIDPDVALGVHVRGVKCMEFAKLLSTRELGPVADVNISNFCADLSQDAQRIKYKNYIQLCKSVDRIALLDIGLAEDCILDVIP